MESTATNQAKPIPERWPDRLLRRWPRKVAEELYESEEQMERLQTTIKEQAEAIEKLQLARDIPFERLQAHNRDLTAALIRYQDEHNSDVGGCECGLCLGADAVLAATPEARKRPL